MSLLEYRWLPLLQVDVSVTCGTRRNSHWLWILLQQVSLVLCRKLWIQSYFVLSKHISLSKYTTYSLVFDIDYYAIFITDSVNKSHVFGGYFNPKSLARTLTCDRPFAQISVMSSGDHKQYFISMPA